MDIVSYRREKTGNLIIIIIIIDLTHVQPYWTTFSSPSSLVGRCSYSAKYWELVSQVATKQQPPALTSYLTESVDTCVF